MEDSEAPESGPSQTARCLWCGADRPVDVDTCPTCRHAWIDATIDEARDGRLETVNAPAPEPAQAVRWWRRWWMPFAVAALAALVYGVVFWVMWDGTQADEAASSTTLAPTTTLGPPVSTDAPATSAVPTTTSTTTSTSTTTTTTTTTTTLPPIAEVPPAIDVADLTLGAFALGPLRFRAVNNDAVGRLVASFGQPDERFPVGENWGLCPIDTGRVLRWGHLSVILREDSDGEALVGYRLADDPAAVDLGTTVQLRSLSGLALGDGQDRLDSLYANVVTDTLDDGTPIYMVLRSSDKRTLLWGTLSSGADPVVTGINSPRPCDGGPFAP